VSTDQPGPNAMSDDTREREPLRDRADNPAEAGTRSDHAGTGAGLAGPAPGGSQPGGDMAIRAQDRETKPPGGQATSAGGGFGVGSERGSGGSGEGTRPAGDDAETDWLRDAPGGPSDQPADR
jgi:hypothetical protein